MKRFHIKVTTQYEVEGNDCDTAEDIREMIHLEEAELLADEDEIDFYVEVEEIGYDS